MDRNVRRLGLKPLNRPHNGRKFLNPEIDRITAVDTVAAAAYPPRSKPESLSDRAMKVRSSLKSLKSRHKDCRVVRRKGRVYVINKTQKRFKARQG